MPDAVKTRTKRLLVAGATLLLITVFLVGVVVSILNRRSAIASTREWGRLAEFPSAAREIKVTVDGTMFSREFRISFVAPAGNIEKWLQSSPGTSEAKVNKPDPTTRVFEIAPGGGAQRAEVTVDDSTHRVFIHVYWS